ncbi:uncharacterized protein LOC135400537 [Ornithodoros turicata]|uniref:uncharacterized protein LOC135400537 n=1 Tax=Ornithodoros turicata TaxID=34597 RepID=UPI00313A3B3A
MTGDRISLERRRQIVSMSLAVHSQRTIAREVGCCLSSVNRIIQRFRDEGQLEDAPRSERPRATTSDENRAIIAANVVDPFLTVVDLKKELSLQASSTTIRRRLACPGGLRSGSRNTERQDWTLPYATGSVTPRSGATCSLLMRQRLVRSGPSGGGYPPQYVHSVVSSGRHSVSEWGALSHQGLRPLVRLDGRFKGAAYVRVIENELLPCVLDGLFPDGCFVLQQERSPVHMLSTVQRN